MDASKELIRSKTTHLKHTPADAKDITVPTTRDVSDNGVPQLPPPTDSLVQSLLTDMYQISMAYGYWKAERHEDLAVFDLFFRKCPFHGEFAIFAGLEEALRFITHFKFSEEHISYLKKIMPRCEAAFFEYLSKVDCSNLKVYAIKEGTLVFPREPVLRLEGPLVIGQLLETCLLNLLNYASLMATNAARFRLAAGKEKILLEYGLRRAQGPNGAISASRYSYLGGFDGTSNVLAGQLFDMEVRGTHAHAFISTFTGLQDLKHHDLDGVNFVDLVLEYRTQLHFEGTNEGELAAYIAYALAFPDGFLALVDTYDTLESGVPNFLTVGLALHKLGHQPVGIRLDSGDLAYLSREARRMFVDVSERFKVDFRKLNIVASNDINEEILKALKDQKHEIDTFGIGTHLVTCQAQPALGMVYKLVEIRNEPRIKLSEELSKVTIPGRKECYRLIGHDGIPILDLMVRVGEPVPQVGQRMYCRHPFEEKKRAYVTPSHVVPLHALVWDGQLLAPYPTLAEQRQYCQSQIDMIRPDHIRPVNPTPYKVSVSADLYNFIHDLWQKEAPIVEFQ
eukprot:GILK01001554.1.p1 GENE.GILK01001554.1~~GILK01001554.1.p1  ORF type:complete len:579 (-),score=86.69 GILK01001554.1:80-1774(-)